jgi:hypothetical protein
MISPADVFTLQSLTAQPVTIPGATTLIAGVMTAADKAKLDALMPGDITSLGPVGTSPNGDAATVTGSVLNLEPADASNPGVVTAGAQTLGGNKAFTGSVSAANVYWLSSCHGYDGRIRWCYRSHYQRHAGDNRTQA